jgi:DNA polymerase II small subunit
MEAHFQIHSEYDVTGKSNSEGTTKDFLSFFQDRFSILSELIKRRGGIAPKPLKRIVPLPKNEEVDIIGMVYKTWKTKNDHLAMELEDTEAKVIALVLKNDTALQPSAQKVMPDDVIGVKGIKLSDNLMIAKELIWPDIPHAKQRLINKPVSIATLTDVHVGSKLFLEKEFQEFLSWINGNCIPEEQELVGSIKYLMITGDNVDGVGVYPGQENELAIQDVYEQYETFCKLILQIPEYIEIFLIPGNHDAVRRADPQPALPEKMVALLKGRKNIHSMGSPAWIDVEGLKIVLHHGASLHDLISSVSYLDSEHPAKAMADLLMRRTLMSTYGKGQPYVPEKKDYMAMKEVPDYIFFGEMHHNDYTHYRGTTIINGGTWQARTGYQVKLGHVPTPGVVPIVRLDTGKITEKRFYTPEEEVHGEE